MASCKLCGRSSRLISRSIGVCARCLKTRGTQALEYVRRYRRFWRLRIGLPGEVPRGGSAPVKCSICVNECVIPEGASGYCGVWINRGGRLAHTAGPGSLVAFTYLDPLPTNCVATPVCPAATARGFPEYTDTRGPETGFANLAVFMGGCPLDCAFCQNWEHKAMISDKGYDGFLGVLHGAWIQARIPSRTKSVEELVEEALDPRVRCVCYFGGDPTPQSGLLVAASRRMWSRARAGGQRFKRICWETDGLVSPSIMREMARTSLETGGIVKIDWKAWTPEIYEALTGVDGYKAHERLKENVKLVASMAKKRREPPLLVVSVLLVPGYVGPSEVYRIARYVASVNPETPIVLLAFHPDYLMPDLPTTSTDHAVKAVRAARQAGVSEVYLGNEWLLRPSYTVEDWWDPEHGL